MPYWVVIVIVVVLVVGYHLLSKQAADRRRGRVGRDFAKIPGFHANQTYTDVEGEVAIGIDDRGRRIAVARKHAQPRTRVYSFAHVLSAQVLQDDEVIAIIKPAEQVAQQRTAPIGPRLAGGQLSEEGRPAGGESAGTTVEQPSGAPEDSLFGSTRRAARPRIVGLPVLEPIAGQLMRVAVRVTFRGGGAGDEVLLRFYKGKPVSVDGAVSERALAEARLLFGSLDIAMKRAGLPPRGSIAPKTPVL